MIFLFYLLAFVAIFGAVMVVASRSPINSVIYLIISFLAFAGHYILLNAQFLAIVHIIVYTGAVMVLFIFVIMLLNLNKKNEPHKKTYVKLMAVISGGLLFLVLVASAKGADQLVQLRNFDDSIGLVARLGKVLYNEFLIPFEVTSVLFLSAMIGAVMLGKKDVKKF